jgi:hypothetical protein
MGTPAMPKPPTSKKRTVFDSFNGLFRRVTYFGKEAESFKKI